MKMPSYIFFKRLSNPLRIRIIDSLVKKPKTVTDLSKDLNVEQSKLSHALQCLYCCSIVHRKKKGKNIIYSLNKETILPIFKLIQKHEKKFCKICRSK